jgi:hypothetical protein
VYLRLPSDVLERIEAKAKRERRPFNRILKTRIFASITIQETAGGLDEKFLRESADRPALLLYAMP